MVVMESNICGMAVGTPSRFNLGDTNQNLSSSPPPANRWYDHMAAQSAAAFQQFGGANGLPSSEAEIADAYFKCNNAAAASTYFSQMQGAYGSMGSHTNPQHGKSIVDRYLLTH